MEIVPTKTIENSESGLAGLSIRKLDLKKKIEEQKNIISTTSNNLLAPVSFTSILFQTFGKGVNVVDTILIGYKIVKIFRKIFGKK